MLMIPMTLLIFHLVGIYQRYWQYASIDELVLIANAVFFATITIGGFVGVAHILSLPGADNIPRSIPLIFLPFALFLVAAPRFLLRVVKYRQERPPRSRKTTKVLIVGAGRGGILIVREILQNPQLGFLPIGFVDDDESKKLLKIHGVPVLGTRYDIPALVQTHEIAQVIIAMPAVSGKTIREIVAICEKAKVPTRTMPGVYELLDGKVSVNQLRPVQIEDLLRREPVQTDIEAVHTLVEGNHVLVTGAGGSIGSEICRQVLRCRPASLTLVGHGENSIFTIHNELKKQAAGVPIHPVIADLRFFERLQSIFHKHRPDLVFHAAAHKHVPLMEEHPSEAITNNVLGTRNLLDVSLAAGVQHFVMISSDKAVNSTNVMGASKRVAELLVHQAAQRSGRAFVSVRFGNVLGSRGSVVLTFKEQIATGGPVTITHPEITRYFMTIPEAVQLVLQAAVLGKGGEVFVLDMGDPIKIFDLARDMIELSGLEVGRDIDIVYTGLRPGEKMYEELFVAGEQHHPTIHPKIRVATRAERNGSNSNGDRSRELATQQGSNSMASLEQQVEMLIAEALRDNEPSIIHLLQEINPLYCPIQQHGKEKPAAISLMKPAFSLPSYGESNGLEKARSVGGTSGS
jgi:FlaA1/EpsC-like NDP-sugar epimerase